MKEDDKKLFPFPQQRGIEEKLNIESDPIEIDDTDVKFNTDPRDDAYDDYVILRKKLHHGLDVADAVMKKQMDNMEYMKTHKDVDAMSNLLRTYVTLSEKTLGLHENFRKLKPKQIEELEEKDELKEEAGMGSIDDVLDELEKEEAEEKK